MLPAFASFDQLLPAFATCDQLLPVAHLLPDVRDLVPGDVDGSGVEGPGPDLGGGDLRHVLGGVDLDRLGHGALALGLLAHVVEHLVINRMLTWTF